MTMVHEKARVTVIRLRFNRMKDDALAANTAIEWLETSVETVACFRNECSHTKEMQGEPQPDRQILWRNLRKYSAGAGLLDLPIEHVILTE